VIPTRAKIHPNVLIAVNFFFKKTLEKIAVIIITPPFDICQTELEINAKPTYERLDAIKSKKAGIIIKYLGICYFYPSALSDVLGE
jgi:hypothetical protein